MKKTLFTICIAIPAFVLASCNSIDSKLDALEKACESGDITAITKAAASLDQEDESKLTEEQKVRLAEITVKCANKQVEQFK